MSIHYSRCALLLLLVLLPPVATQGQTTWNGAGGNDLWNNLGNWDTGIVPVGITDDVFVGAPSPTEVNVSVNLNSLTVGSGGNREHWQRTYLWFWWNSDYHFVEPRFHQSWTVYQLLFIEPSS